MTNKTISNTVHGYNFAASNTNLTITATGKITGSSPAAIYGAANRSGDTVLNLGKVGDANYLYGVLMKDGATITNGSATDKTASITGSSIGIRIDGRAGAIANFGSISADQKGVVLNKGGAVTNGSATDTTARISAGDYDAVTIAYGAGKVTNFGAIQGEVSLYGGGSVTNQASGKMTSLNAIYLVGGAGTVTNLGAISGHVHVGSGQVVNGSKTDHTASIAGGSYGVYLGSGTLTNFGTISGTNDSLSLHDGSVLIAEAGSKLLGGASYGQGATLVFGAAGGAGTISGLGTGSITGSTTEKFREMTTYQIQAGGDWTLSGTKNNLKAGDSLTVFGSLTLGGSLLGAGSLSIGKTGTIKATTGSVAIGTAIVNTGVLAVSGGTLTLDRAVTGAGVAKISGGTLFAEGAFSENVTFGAKGQLELAHSLTYKGSVTGFSHAGTTSLDLRDIKFGAGTKATFAGTAAGGTLSVTDGTHTSTIKLVGNYTGVTFKASSDGHGGTTIVDAAKAAALPHFVAAMAAMGADTSGSTLAQRDAPPTTATLLAHPRA